MSTLRNSLDTQTGQESCGDVGIHPPTGSAQITQEMLAAYEDLKRCEQEKDRFRTFLLCLLDQGAEVEPGPLTVELKEREERRFSFARLRRVVGQADVEQLRSRIEPTFCRYLRVYRVVQDDPGNGRQTGG